jgi:hypothetical protein
MVKPHAFNAHDDAGHRPETGSAHDGSAETGWEYGTNNDHHPYMKEIGHYATDESVRDHPRSWQDISLVTRSLRACIQFGIVTYDTSRDKGGFQGAPHVRFISRSAVADGSAWSSGSVSRWRATG